MTESDVPAGRCCREAAAQRHGLSRLTSSWTPWAPDPGCHLWLTELWGTRIPIERYEVLLPADARDAGETAGAAISHTTTLCLRRRFDLAERLPTGLIALGSSLCCLDPRSERGVVVAALHARLLQQLLAEHDAEGSAGRSRLVPRRYFDAVMRVPSWLSPDTVMTPARDGVYPWP